MSSDLWIEIDFLPNRLNPSELFEAMSYYIAAYNDIGQIVTKSAGLDIEFQFQLDGVEIGSILSRLSAMPSKLDEKFRDIIIKSGNSLFYSLTSISETSTESEVEDIAMRFEQEIFENTVDSSIDPYVDRVELMSVLNKISLGNSKIKSGETVALYRDNKSYKTEVNSNWRFTGDPRSMFKGKVTHHQVTEKLTVPVTVNEGDSVWTFKNMRMGKKFIGRIIDKEWLEKYQSGIIPPIGPFDVLEANIHYDMYRKKKRKGSEIQNAKIIKVINVHRDGAHQYEL